MMENLDAIRARAAHLEAMRVELLPREAALTDAERDRAELLAIIDAQKAAAEPDAEGMRVARAVAQWHLGYGYWAEKLVGAYLNPEAAEASLRREKGEDDD
jgi:hypothetical protein